MDLWNQTGTVWTKDRPVYYQKNTVSTVKHAGRPLIMWSWFSTSWLCTWHHGFPEILERTRCDNFFLIDKTLVITRLLSKTMIPSTFPSQLRKRSWDNLAWPSQKLGINSNENIWWDLMKSWKSSSHHWSKSKHFNWKQQEALTYNLC